MQKMFLINFSLMEKIADKKNGITTEDATAFITGVELFFVGLMIELLIVGVLPFMIPRYATLGIMVIIWYYTHYVLRKSLRKKIIETRVRKSYNDLKASTKKKYLLLSIVCFCLIIFIFFVVGVLTIYNYDKRWK